MLIHPRGADLERYLRGAPAGRSLMLDRRWSHLRSKALTGALLQPPLPSSRGGRASPARRLR